MMNLAIYPISMFGLELHHLVRIVEAWVGWFFPFFGGNFYCGKVSIKNFYYLE